ncbi:hypothetical protein [Clostridium nigeriense]|uniref:hypothetical protein n=1 Tax=Clostridium nigeriense TaxID=1805470 RepID=UPI00082F0263|nr:hypothetical protein [Clostridium nigeriense]
MVSIEQNIHILKQSNGSIWNFLYDKRLGITYKIYEKNKWSNIYILTKKTTGKYSVSLLPNDTICLIYENLSRQLVMKIYTNKKWSYNYIVKNQEYDEIDTYFKAIFIKNDLLLFCSIYNKYTNVLTINSYIIDNKYNLGLPSLVDKFFFENNINFSLSSIKDNVYILYQKKETNYTLGYKLYNTNSKTYSEFYKIDESIGLFKDYYLLSLKNELHSIYTKIDTNKSYLLNYCKITLSLNNCISIFKSKSSFSSSIFIAHRYIWCFWFKDNKLFSTVSIDGGNSFIKPYQVDEVNNLKIYKAYYISNVLENKNIMCIGYTFIININSPKLLVIDNIYELIYKHSQYNSYRFYILYFLSLINIENNSNNISFSDKDILIQKQSNIIKKQKTKLLSNENKLNSIKNLIEKFNENTYQLNESISLLQDDLSNKETELNELKKLYIEKELELELLKKETKTMKLKKVNTFKFKEILSKLTYFLKD